MTIKDRIRRRIEEIGTSPNRVSKLQRVSHPKVVRRFLYGDAGCRAELIEELLRVLELEVVPREVLDDLKSVSRAAIFDRVFRPEDHHYSRNIEQWFKTGVHPRAVNVTDRENAAA